MPLSGSTPVRGSLASTASSGISATPTPAATIACIVPLSSERNTTSALRPRSDRCVSMCWMLVQVR